MRIATFMAVVLVLVVAWLVIREGPAPIGDPGDRIAVARQADDHTSRDDSPPPVATTASREPELSELEEEAVVDAKQANVAAREVAGDAGNGGESVASVGDADLDVTIVVPEEDHWLWSQLPPKIRIYRSLPDAVEPDFETLVGERWVLYAAMTADELHAVTEEGRRPTEDEVRLDVANNFGRLRRERVWGAPVRQAVAILDETTHVRGLAPGRYVVTLQRGDSLRHPRVFDEQTVDLPSGATALTLTIPVLEERTHVHLAGTIHYSSEWGERQLRLDFDPASVAGATDADERSLMLSDLEPADGAPDLYRFEIGDVLPGRYVVTAAGFDWRQAVVTGAAGRDDAAIVVPDPANVLVHLVDDETAAPISEPIALFPRGGLLVESHRLPVERAQWDDGAKAYRMIVPAGAFEWSSGLELIDTFEAVGRTCFTVQPGPNDVTIRVRRSTVIALSLQCDGEPVDSGAYDFKVELASVDDPQKKWHPSTVTARQMFTRVPAAGRYRVTVPLIPGFAEVAPFEVTARQGERVDFTIQLLRTR